MSKNILSQKPKGLTLLQYIRMLAGFSSIAAAARKLKWPYQRLQKLENYEHFLSAADAVDLFDAYRPPLALSEMVAKHNQEFATNHKPRQR